MDDIFATFKYAYSHMMAAAKSYKKEEKTDLKPNMQRMNLIMKNIRYLTCGRFKYDAFTSWNI